MSGLGISVTTGGESSFFAPSERQRDERMASKVIEDALLEAGLSRSKLGFYWTCGLDTFGSGAIEERRAGSCFHEIARPFHRPRRMIAMACASGSSALGCAFEDIRSGRVHACLVGGSSIMLSPFYLIGFASLGAIAVDQEDNARPCRPFDSSRRGFSLGDGAGAIVVESLAHAEARGARPIAEILGFGASQDAFDLSRPPERGEGAILAMRRALDSAQISADEVDAINAHGTATLVGDAAEAAAIRSVFEDSWQNLPVSSVKGAIGHTMAAAGILEAIVAMETCSTGLVPATFGLQNSDLDCELDHVIGEARHSEATIVLSNSFGMGGQNASLIFARMNRASA
ncbi:MAG: beta-ketoacyl-[acyl-carrier-protein] synthase family protein [Myxococcales bacterium]|nr:beta-ketoacyl-[acyl-carrier-protein] synthase family protein [Myxococcales bacterium]